MSGIKMRFTYNRKRRTRNDHLQEDVGYNSASEADKGSHLSNPDMQALLIDENTSEDYETKTAVCHLCVVCCDGGNLMHCDKCLQSYHLECVDKHLKHAGHGIVLNCGCLAAALGDDGNVCNQSVTPVGYTLPLSINGRESSLDVNSIRLNSSELAETDSFAEVKLENLFDDLPVQTKWKTPLLTFHRRSKRRKATNECSVQSTSQNIENNCSVITNSDKFAPARIISCEATSIESFSLDPGEDLNPNKEVIEITYSQAGSSTGLMHTERVVNEGALQQAGKIPDQSGQTLMDVKEEAVDHLGSSLTCMKDSSSGTVPLCTDTQLVKEEPQILSSDDDGKPAGTSHLGRNLPNLNLSVISTDSNSCALDLNADLNLSPREQAIIAAPKSTLRLFGCTSRSPASVLPGLPPTQMVAAEERIKPDPSLLNKDASDSSEIGASCRDYDQVFNSNKKCLQLFSEEKTNDIAHPVMIQPEVSNYMTSEDIKRPHLGSNNNNQQKQGSLLNLGLPLPTRPSAAGYATSACLNTFPFFNSFSGSREFINNAGLQSSSSHLSSIFRHKMMHDNLASQAGGLNEMGSFNDTYHPYNTMWSEEELDFLWIGVRRYGQENWNTMLMDPRLRFSPWRVARDLATRWREEQSNLLSSMYGSQVKYTRAQDSSLTSFYQNNFLRPQTGFSAQSYLAGGNVSRRPQSRSTYVCNDGQEVLYMPISKPKRVSRRGSKHIEDEFYSSSRTPRVNLLSTELPSTYNVGMKGNVPQWLQEAVLASPPSFGTSVPPSTTSSSHAFPHPNTLSVPVSASDPTESHCEERTGTQHTPGEPLARNASRLSAVSGPEMAEQKPDSSRGVVGQENLIVIDSDPSSEGTISD